MRFYLLLLIFLSSFTANSQEIKKKYLGVFAGEIPSYALELGQEVYSVESTLLEIQLKPEGVVIEKMASKETRGRYHFLKEDKNAIYLEVTFDGQFVPESYVLFKKEKRLERKGIYPQPDTFLKKI